MKKILAIVLALALVIIPMTFSVSAEAAATLTVGADKNVEAGEAVAIPVAISGDVVGAQFDIALGDLEYVSCTAEAEDFLYVEKDNTIKYVGANLDGMSNLFTVNVTIPADAVAEATYTPVVSNVVICGLDEGLIETDVVAGTYTVASSAPVAVLDPALTATRAVSISDKLGIGYLVTPAVVKNYDHFEIVATPQKYVNYNVVAGDPIVMDTFEDVKSSKGVVLFKKTGFDGLGMYELGLNVTSVINCYDADNNLVAYSNPMVDTGADLLKAQYATTSDNALKTLVTDTLNMSTEAQKYFGGLYPSSDLASAPLVNAGFSQQYATQDLPQINVVSNTTVEPGAAITTITPALSMKISPVLGYVVMDMGKKLDASKLRIELSYTTLYGANAGEITDVAVGADWNLTSASKYNLYTYAFDKTCLYDGNKTVTAKLYYDGKLCLTNTYSVDNGVNDNKNDAATGALYISVAKFGAAARAFFGTN